MNSAERTATHRAVSILPCIITGVKLLAAIFLVSAPFAVAAVGARVLPPTAQEAVRPESAEFFEARVRPVLAANCYDCHTEEQLGGLRLDSREAMLKGGKRGPAIVPGDPDHSLLVAAVRQSGDLKMPKGGRLKPEDVDALAAWVRAGAPWPTAAKTTAAAKAGGYVIKPEQRAFWAFQPIRKPAIPAVANTGWAKTDIDRFVLARLDKERLTPVKPADRLTLLRRATLDLTGLPPTPEDVEAFANDTSVDAFAKVVDRLLASPRYGEAWGRQWLDVA